MGSDPSEDYYGLLGIPPDADAAQLRRAWRKLALRWHPDRAGSTTTFIFQKISSAYAVLSDPASRAAYDRRRGTSPRGSTSSTTPPAPPPRRAPSVMLARLSGSLPTLIACGLARRAEDGVIELVVGEEDATQGGIATISMRVPARCHACEGRGCDRCGSRGTTDELFSAWITLPPDVAEGTILSPSVLLPGMAPVRFRICRPDAA